LQHQPVVACLDLEGVLVPEIWIGVAERTGIAELRRTTRDEPNYDLLMRKRIEILHRHRLGLANVQAVIAEMRPLDGALEFLTWLRGRCQVIILSDTFEQFAWPLMKQLHYPTLFCNTLDVDGAGRIVGYRLRLPEQKRASATALRQIGFRVVAAGDSYNDTGMLLAADAGIFFRPPEKIAAEFPQFPVTRSYAELRSAFVGAGVTE
jgi:phosphoserine/homoserine phosphotransferase